MFKFTFVKTPKPRAFYHRPIYWNPEEEERKERLERVRKDLGERDENEPYKASIKRGYFVVVVGNNLMKRLICTMNVVVPMCVCLLLFWYY